MFGPLIVHCRYQLPADEDRFEAFLAKEPSINYKIFQVGPCFPSFLLFVSMANSLHVCQGVRQAVVWCNSNSYVY